MKSNKPRMPSENRVSRGNQSVDAWRAWRPPTKGTRTLQTRKHGSSYVPVGPWRPMSC
jgi:hypothetical protein